MQVGTAAPPAEQVAPMLVGPAVQAVCAALPCVQVDDAETPAVQVVVASAPAVHAGAGVAAPPAVQAAAPPLPAVQAPDPLAISPKGTRTGDSYFDFPLAFWSDIAKPPFSKCIYLAIRKRLHRPFSKYTI